MSSRATKRHAERLKNNALEKKRKLSEDQLRAALSELVDMGFLLLRCTYGKHPHVIVAATEVTHKLPSQSAGQGFDGQHYYTTYQADHKGVGVQWRRVRKAHRHV